MTTLAKTLSTLRESADLSRRQLEEVSGVSEETLKKIEYGRNQRPAPETLRKIAVGLATNRALGRIDQGAADEMYATLMRAADYLPRSEPVPASDPEPAFMPSSIEAELSALFQPDEAPLVAEILRAWARHDEPTRQYLLRTMKPLILELPGAERSSGS